MNQPQEWILGHVDSYGTVLRISSKKGVQSSLPLIGIGHKLTWVKRFILGHTNGITKFFFQNYLTQFYLASHKNW